MSTPEPLGAQGETCEACASPLAPDQRYCLNCGARRAGPRVDYRAYMSGVGDGVAPHSANGATPAGDQGEAEVTGKKERDFAPLAAVGGIAVLGLMLLVGVLIGKGDNETAAAPAPVVVHGGAETAAAGEGPEENGAAVGGKGAKGSAKTSGKSVAGGAKGSTGAAATPSTDDLEALHESSGGSYEQESKNLPNEIATPGAPPPIDKSEAAGGGEGGAVTIK